MENVIENVPLKMIDNVRNRCLSVVYAIENDLLIIKEHIVVRFQWIPTHHPLEGGVGSF